MAYLKTTANGPVDLLQKINAWLVSIGWASDCSKADGAGWWTTLHKNGNYISLRAHVNEGDVAMLPSGSYGSNTYGIQLTMGTGYTASPTIWCNQPGAPVDGGGTNVCGCGCRLPSGAIIAAHFFSTDANNEHIIIVIEKTPNIFGYLGWGPSIEKCGSFVGGQYFFADLDEYYYSNPIATGPGFTDSAVPPCSYANDRMMAYIRCDIDSNFTGKWVGIGNTTQTYQGYTGRRGGSTCRWNGDGGLVPVLTYIENRFTTTLTGQSVLVPIRLFAERQTAGFSLIGNLPNIFQTSACWQGFANGGTYQWGTDNYIVFPGPTNDPRGFAVKLVS